uniref:Uncharacterized protein n=1 Tax=Anguilla anguilla TaxID=7936 RepID=A0A0E9TDG8_ANGAN
MPSFRLKHVFIPVNSVQEFSDTCRSCVNARMR